MDKISLIVPCYNEEDSLPTFYQEIINISRKMEKQIFEFIFIDDGSKDNTLKILKQLNQEDKRVRFISFSRNFGKEAGLLAGFEYSTGDYVAVLDADLQHPPSLIPEMYDILKNENYECAAARRISRKGEPFIRSLFSKLFYKIMQKISQIELVQGASDYRLMSRKMINAILSINEYNRFSKGIFSWVGFSTKWITYENIERAAGNTKWSFWSLLAYAMDGIIAFSTFPLLLTSILGILFCIISLIMIIVVVIKTLIWGEPVAGYPSLICILFFVSGIQLFCLGILGQYLSKTYMETKKRPSYIINCTESDLKNEK